MNLSRLVYYSQRNPAQAMNVKDLIAVCERNNRRLNITGILFFNGDHFVQVLEGGRAEVSTLYHRIARDDRHSNIILLECVDARERLFPAWSMALHEGNETETRSVFLRYFSTDDINPETVNVESLLDVLQDFAADQARTN